MKLLLRKLRHELNKGVRRLLHVPSEVSPEYPLDFSENTIGLCRRVRPFTMTSNERIAVLEQAVRHVVRQDIEGDFVECGVARGGSGLAMALTLLDMNRTDRDLWLYDTFEGMPEPTDEDMGRYGNKAMRKYEKRLKDGVSTWINRPEEVARGVMASCDYPASRLHFVKGMIEQTLPTTAPDRVALLHLDTDFYASTKCEMELLFPKVTAGGAVIVDDYYRWQGNRKAVDDYVNEHRIPIFWSRIDDHGVIGIKPSSEQDHG